jgi:hypothetical protein
VKLGVEVLAAGAYRMEVRVTTDGQVAVRTVEFEVMERLR